MPIFRNPQLVTDPTMTGSTRPTPQPTPQPQAQQAPSRNPLAGFFGGDGSGWGKDQGYDDDPRSRVNKLGALMMMLDPMSANAGQSMLGLQQTRVANRQQNKQKNETQAWLGTQGVGAQEAKYLASDPTALHTWYTSWKSGQTPDWQIHEIYDAKGNKQNYMIDMHSGAMSPVGGSAKEKPNVSIESIFDKDGNEQKVIFNHDDPTNPIPLGGSKSGLLSPEELAQKKELAAAGASKTDINTKGESKQSEKLGEGLATLQLDTQKSVINAPKTTMVLNQMEHLVNQPGFDGGGGQIGADFKLKVRQAGKALGWDTGDLGTMEQFNALSKRSVLEMLGGSLGTGVSNADVNYLDATVPNIGTSKEGALALIRIGQRTQAQQQGAAQVIRDYAAQHGGVLDMGIYDVISKYNKANPIMRPEDIKYIDGLVATDQQTGGGGGNTQAQPAFVPGDQDQPVPGMDGVTVRITPNVGQR